MELVALAAIVGVAAALMAVHGMRARLPERGRGDNRRYSDSDSGSSGFDASSGNGHSSDSDASDCGDSGGGDSGGGDCGGGDGGGD
jgi:hypothetical protein